MVENSFYLFKAETLFWLCAITGSCMFAVQFVLNLLGATDYESADSHHGGDVKDFKWLSIQAITGFLMMFGWTGLTCQKEFELSNGPTILFASAAGLFSVFVTNYIFKLTRKLHSSGTVFNVEDTIGLQAQVYHRIPKGGIGKVSVTLQQFSREIDAVSHRGEEIPSFTHVQIIKKKDDNTVVVTTV